MRCSDALKTVACVEDKADEVVTCDDVHCADAQRLLDMCENSLAEQRKILHRRNVLHAKLVDRAFDACIDCGHWRRAVEHGVLLAQLLR